MYKWENLCQETTNIHQQKTPQRQVHLLINTIKLISKSTNTAN